MRFLLVLAALLLAGSLGRAAETTTFVSYFSGGLPFCSQCGNVSSYACSPDANGVTLGRWNNGRISFTDPIPTGNYATKIAATVFGSYSCNAVNQRAMFGLSLNGHVHGVRDTSKGSNGCKCDTCDGSEAFTFSFRNGVPHYNYRSNNTLGIELFRDSICLNRVQVTITYEPLLSSPPTPLPEKYFNFTIPREFDRVGCPVCNSGLNQWCSAPSNNSLSLFFKDPLPSNVYLVAADVYLSLNLVQRSSAYLTTLNAYLQDTAIGGSTTISETNWKDKCGCLGDYQFQSSLYQRGWPGYAVGGVNYLTININKYSQNYGNVCIGRVAVKLIYYQISEGQEVQLKSLFLEDVRMEG